ncbi:superkiller complex protein 2 [Hetaerina americana]|uniref:superkiller complex protein 2 n=1 Tax=Hetaerina americana TaxID=62018 RepID=UPI003A7F51A9
MSNSVENELEVKVQLPFGPPPVLPDVKKELQSFLLCTDKLPIHDFRNSQRFWKRTPNPTSLFDVSLSPLGTNLKVERDPTTGELLGLKEVVVRDVGAHARNSASLSRAPGPPSEAVRGSVSNVPFWPAGIPKPPSRQDMQIKKAEDGGIDFENDLITCPPGMSRGYEFEESEKAEVVSEAKEEREEKGVEKEEAAVATAPKKKGGDEEEEEDEEVNLAAVLQQEQSIWSAWNKGEGKKKRDRDADKENKPSALNIVQQKDKEDLEKVIPKEDNIPIINISKPVKEVKKITDKWAEMIDMSQPVLDFRQRLPIMAHEWHFELDTFQKQAILLLEKKNHVFVSAHTSAGKTVVAEYAIAMAMRNKTRVVYTSPIKALSNQKYRDFKTTFQDVGLITGDIQINQTASCLIMTTEILRSMLYRGSDTLRDLEFVIFDEVHYINDAERGHVWEEVLIQLQENVTIVMLSATVPNTMEFAQWVGQTVGRKVYVISTLKRPVPLEHYIYTGTGGSTKDNCFLILDSTGKFLQEGYHNALESVKTEKPPQVSSQGKDLGRGGGRGGGGGGGRGGGRGGGGGNRGHPPRTHRGNVPLYKMDHAAAMKQEKTLWIALLDFLRKKDKLPVVIFTLSRKLCDQYAEALSSQNLNTKVEKSRVHQFFKHSLRLLKEPDRKLPQVMKMQELLEQGIGIHHSGILPILKEIVEIMFQERKVKVLFATETFAMGVNMPARTVVFESHTKYDGLQTRPLLPAEYIQMAGRAGRRELDPTGTVIIMAKKGVPDLETLNAMMMGKPKALSSKFRLTYSMILNLMKQRGVSITVEQMMSMSFREMWHKRQVEEVQTKLPEVESQLRALIGAEEMERETRDLDKMKVTSAELITQMDEFYMAATKFLEEWCYDMPVIMKTSQAMKVMAPGRVVIISYGEYRQHLAVVLKNEITSTSASRATKPFYVLHLCDDEENQGDSSEINLVDTQIRQPIQKVKKTAAEVEFDEQEDHWNKLLSLANPKELYPEESMLMHGNHTVTWVKSGDILAIVDCIIKIEVDRVIADWDKRQIPRFRQDPPGPSCSHVIRELTQLSLDVSSGIKTMQLLNPLTDLGIKDIKMFRIIEPIMALKSELSKFDFSQALNFEDQFKILFKKKWLEDRKSKLEFMKSHESLSLYPEYCARVRVLRELQYIDQNNHVQMKGRAACQLSSNNQELILTEIIFQHVFNSMEPTEMAALLSALVFQAKTNIEPVLTKTLEEGKKTIENIAKEVDKMQIDCGLEQGEMMNDSKLNFGLVEVVYEWALSKPFAEIVPLTDVQEGIIVRCIVQLNEMLQDMKKVANTFGDVMLVAKFEEASQAIKRDIVFAASLYTE